jgi:hypothetical protein
VRPTTCGREGETRKVRVKEKGQLGEELPLFRPLVGRSAKNPGLGEVIAEGGEDHVLDGLGALADAWSSEVAAVVA